MLGTQAITAIACGLSLQAILFSHGGISSFGINLLVMGIPAILAGMVFKISAKRINPSLPEINTQHKLRFWAFISGSGSVLLVIAFYSLALWIGATADWRPQILLNAGVHIPLAIIEGLASHPRVRAIGETGLDFFRTEPALQEKQRYSFKRHIKMAKDHNKALVIHDRDSHQAVLDLLDQEGAPSNTIFHCFSGDVAMAKECIAKKYYLSFAGTVTFKNAPELRQAAALVPIDLILVETDSPFLAPMPNRGSLNTPAQIPNTLRVLADVRDESVDYLAAAISENAERIFGKF
jgi:TatD family hydrolase